jgi:hypothetical protein
VTAGAAPTVDATFSRVPARLGRREAAAEDGVAAGPFIDGIRASRS